MHKEKKGKKAKEKLRKEIAGGTPMRVRARLKNNKNNKEEECNFYMSRSC